MTLIYCTNVAIKIIFFVQTKIFFSVIKKFSKLSDMYEKNPIKM